MSEDKGGYCLVVVMAVVFIPLLIANYLSPPPPPPKEPPAHTVIGTVTQATYQSPGFWEGEDHIVVVSTPEGPFVFSRLTGATEATELWSKVRVGSKVEMTVQGDHYTARPLP